MKRPTDSRTYRPEIHADINPKIMRELSRVIIQALIEDEDGVALPYPFGTLAIEGKEANAIDRRKTADNGEIVNYQNYHTDGRTFSIKLFKHRTGYLPIKQRSIKLAPYTFKAYDKLKDALRDNIYAGNWKHYKLKDQ